MSDEDCYVCGEPVPDEYGKWDDRAPVYDPEHGGVYHKGCEDEVFAEVFCETGRRT